MSGQVVPSGAGLGRRVAGVAVAVATALAIAGLTIALSFNPAWVSFAQTRADAAAWTGWTPEQVDRVTRDIVIEVWLGPGTFAQDVAGVPVFADREIDHMVDVRRVTLGFFALVLVGAATLVVAGVAARGSAWFWRCVGMGAGGLAVGAVVVGGAFFLFFDAAFTLFHQLFFAEGTWTFDPASDRLVQLFPYRFWTETSVAIAVLGLGMTLATWAIARRLARTSGGSVPPGASPAAAGA